MESSDDSSEARGFASQQDRAVHQRMLRDLDRILGTTRRPLENHGRWIIGAHHLFGHPHLSAHDTASGCWIVQRLDDAPDSVYVIGPELPIHHCDSWSQARLLALVHGGAAEVPLDADLLPYRLQLEAELPPSDGPMLHEQPPSS